MRAWEFRPGVPAAGHVTASGFWHPGRIEGCVKCPSIPPMHALAAGQRVRLDGADDTGTIEAVRFDGDDLRRVLVLWDTGRRGSWNPDRLVPIPGKPRR